LNGFRHPADSAQPLFIEDASPSWQAGLVEALKIATQRLTGALFDALLRFQSCLTKYGKSELKNDLIGAVNNRVGWRFPAQKPTPFPIGGLARLE
jgi:hypothetical protein